MKNVNFDVVFVVNFEVGEIVASGTILHFNQERRKFS